MRPLDAAIATGLLAGLCGNALAGEEVRLKEGPGRDLVLGNCSACHSADYIQMNSPFMKRAAWEATVNKMINALKAPIDPADAKAITDYLAKNYGI